MELSGHAKAPSSSSRHGGAGFRAARLILSVVLLTVVAATAYQAAIAAGMMNVGPAPGQTPAGDNPSFAAALLALLCGGAVLAVSFLRPRAAALLAGTRLLPAVSIAAACLVVARFFSYDPYYAPTLRRMSDGGILPGTWIVAVVVLAGIAALVARGRRPRAAAGLTAAVMWLSAITAMFAAGGH